MFGLIISSLTKRTSGSINDAKPLGAPKFLLDFNPVSTNNKSITINAKNIEATFLVIEKSIECKPDVSKICPCESSEYSLFSILTLDFP